MVQIPQEFSTKVINTKVLSPRTIFVQLASTKPIPFAPGQYASWLIDSHRRPLSFASLPTAPTLDFVVGTTLGGVCSQYVQRLQINDTVRFLAPYGRFTLEEDQTRPLLFIATGTGIAPIRAQIYYILATRKTQASTLIFGNKDEQHALLNDEFTSLSHHHPTFTFIPTLTNASANWSGVRGLVTTVVPDQIPNLSQYSAYICGNPAMVRDMITVLQSHHLPKEHIHTEQYL